MRAQTEAAVREADVALFLIDGREGLTPLDEEIARWLRGEDTPVVVAANKAEGKAGEAGRLPSRGPAVHAARTFAARLARELSDGR
jgi:GTP-binding protein